MFFIGGITQGDKRVGFTLFCGDDPLAAAGMVQLSSVYMTYTLSRFLYSNL